MKLQLIKKKIKNQTYLVTQLVKYNIDGIRMKRIPYKSEGTN